MEEEHSREEKWSTVWFNQWEPAEKNTQYAHDCYVYHFGTCLDKAGQDTTNVDIEEVDKSLIPDFNLLVGGFPCQDYSVASSLATSRGLEGEGRCAGGDGASVRAAGERGEAPEIPRKPAGQRLRHHAGLLPGRGIRGGMAGHQCGGLRASPEAQAHIHFRL